MRKTLGEGERVVSFICSVKVTMIKNITFNMKMHKTIKRARGRHFEMPGMGQLLVTQDSQKRKLEVSIDNIYQDIKRRRMDEDDMIVYSLASSSSH